MKDKEVKKHLEILKKFYIEEIDRLNDIFEVNRDDSIANDILQYSDLLLELNELLE